MEDEDKENKKEQHESSRDNQENREQTKHLNKQLRNVLIVILLVSIFAAMMIFFFNSAKVIEYKGVKFREHIDEAGNVFFNAKLPVYNSENEKVSEKNFFIRTNPKKLKNVSFDGSLEINKRKLVFDQEDNKSFRCNGFGNIAVLNIKRLYKSIGVESVNANATCQPNSDYIYVKLKEGSEGRVVQTAPSCYDIYINECEVFKPTEKFMAETFVEVNENIESKLDK